jgi:RNA-directed DNA polymerase
MTTGSADAGPQGSGTILDREGLAQALNVTPRKLRFLLYKVPAESRYRTFEIGKRGGGVRQILAPIPPLKELQAKVAALLETKYTPRSCVYGYVKQRNILQNARRHQGKRWVLRIDLENFFPSINFGRVRGMLMAKPFEFAEEVATTIAQLCCHENQLPQGSPASPTISNIICRGLDNTLAKLAREQKCTYTRYCDDIVFSTQLRKFPQSLARLTSTGTVVIGPELRAAIEDHGFAINKGKLHLRSKMQRQMVTGLVVNDRANVPRKLTRELRMVLHVWRKLGPEGVQGWYKDKKNRPPGKDAPPLNRVIQGRLQYLGSIRGWDDHVYKTLAAKLAKLDPTFSRTIKTSVARVSSRRLKVYVEGTTDKAHMETALKVLQLKGQFADLRLDLDDKEDGNTSLLAFCEKLNRRPQATPHVFLFDSDVPEILNKVRSPDGRFKVWRHNLYSLVLPTPKHREGDGGICIELVYNDADLTRKDSKGRRLYRLIEFEKPSGRHRVEPGIYTTLVKKNTLIFDDDVWSHDTGKKVCLSKSDFVELVCKTHVDQVNFEGFVPLFEQLTALRDYIELQVSEDEGSPTYGYEED